MAKTGPLNVRRKRSKIKTWKKEKNFEIKTGNFSRLSPWAPCEVSAGAAYFITEVQIIKQLAVNV